MHRLMHPLTLAMTPSLAGLRDLVAFLYGHAPATLMGSPAVVEEWLHVCALERALQAQRAAAEAEQGTPP